MNISIKTRQAYTEIDNFLDLINYEDRNKIPKQLREMFKKEKDDNYEKKIEINKPISEQNLKEETLGIIALLNLQYWCTDEKEKERLKQIYAKNENKYQEELREKYNPDNIFKRNNKKQKTRDMEEVSMVEYKESLLKKITNLIKGMFSREQKR